MHKDEGAKPGPWDGEDAGAHGSSGGGVVVVMVSERVVMVVKGRWNGAEHHGRWVRAERTPRLTLLTITKD
jgi:hypothetical protein